MSHDIETAALAGELGYEGVLELALSQSGTDAEAILLPDTAMHTARFVNDLERALGKTVLTANQVTLWQGLRLAGITITVPELGKLFSE